MTSSIMFPSVSIGPSPIETSKSALSLARQATALEVCELIYGQADPPPWEVMQRLYEANAIYENPVITATSRDMISDAYALAQRFSRVDVPGPVALLATVFGLKPGLAERDAIFRAVRTWTEIEDVCESESFDGHRRCIVEHTFHILFLPGLHTRRPPAGGSNDPAAPALARTDSSASVISHAGWGGAPVSPRIAVRGRLSVPSPLHTRLRITTRLSFNDAGLIVRHRDVWDVRDVLGLLPGAAAAHWLASRVAARSLSAAVRALEWALPIRAFSAVPEKPDDGELGGPAPEREQRDDERRGHTRGGVRWEVGSSVSSLA